MIDIKDVICEQYGCNHMTAELLNLLEENAPETFNEYCREKITSDASYEEFIDFIPESRCGLDFNDETLEFIYDLYNNCDKNEIKEYWIKSLKENGYMEKTNYFSCLLSEGNGDYINENFDVKKCSNMTEFSTYEDALKDMRENAKSHPDCVCFVMDDEHAMCDSIPDKIPDKFFQKENKDIERD